MDFITEKDAVRKTVIEKIKAMPHQHKVEQSKTICENLYYSTLWQMSSKIFAFAPMDSEVDIWGLLIQGLKDCKTIALPFYVKQCDIYEPRVVRDLEKDVVKGKMGIREPKEECEKLSLTEMDLILVPGVAFSPIGYRLGRGKGYYDKMLANAQGIKCGICYECQYGWDVPVEPHDIKLDCIITPSLWLEFSSQQ
jgi:5-formyltetrahydrofolate cyclo-ligase